MAPPVGGQRAVELSKQVFLLRVQVDRGLDHHPAEEIAGRTPAHRTDALLAQAENAAGLRSGRDLDCGLPLERRDVDAASERRGHETDRDLAGQVRAVALKDRVLAHRDLDIEVARRAAIAARLTLAREPDAVAGVDARRHLHGQPLIRASAALPRALRAGIRDDRA